MLRQNDLIIFPDDKADSLKTAFKWMWLPSDNIVLISYGRNFHFTIYDKYKKQNPNVADFYNWIRFIHLEENDFSHPSPRLLCVRKHNVMITSDDIEKFVRMIGIESNICFDVTNESLKTITGNYFEKY